MNTEEMKHPTKQYANKPNLWRVARELSKLKNPYAVLNAAMAITAPMLEQSEEDVIA